MDGCSVQNSEAVCQVCSKHGLLRAWNNKGAGMPWVLVLYAAGSIVSEQHTVRADHQYTNVRPYANGAQAMHS
jgi:hypothetical protein